MSGAGSALVEHAGADVNARYPVWDEECVKPLTLLKNERWLVGAENLAYLNWLIYSAAFNDPAVEPR